MVGSAAIKQGRSANRKHTYFFFWPYSKTCLQLKKNTEHKNGFQYRLLLKCRSKVLQNTPRGAFCNTFDLH